MIKPVPFGAMEALALTRFRAAVLGPGVGEDSTADQAFAGRRARAGRTSGSPRIPEPKTAKNRMRSGLRASGAAQEEVAWL